MVSNRKCLYFLKHNVCCVCPTQLVDNDSIFPLGWNGLENWHQIYVSELSTFNTKPEYVILIKLNIHLQNKAIHRINNP